MVESFPQTPLRANEVSLITLFAVMDRAGFFSFLKYQWHVVNTSVLVNHLLLKAILQWHEIIIKKLYYPNFFY